ncbi:uncharacterized protein PG998_007144 [Apiospora kogelbergensis]|uniref:Uncharacterized protein n=1 Tax=Apiospora kogelbergensis TaxID=1337665 RepID=A0AAW0QTJ9_9PEZI
MFEGPPPANPGWRNCRDLASHDSLLLTFSLLPSIRLHRPATTYDLLYEIAAEAEKVRRQQENEIFAQRSDMKQ